MDFLARLPFLKGRLSFARMSQKVGIIMKKEHWMTKADLLLILLLVGGSLFFLIEPIFRSRDLDQRWLSVQVDGKLVDEIPLDQNKEKKHIPTELNSGPTSSKLIMAKPSFPRRTARTSYACARERFPGREP